MKGIITKIISNQYTVLVDGVSYLCVAMGKVRLQTKPLVGDWVELAQYDDIYGIEKVLPRHNQMLRPAIANVDQVMIVMSAIDPEFSPTLINRLWFIINHHQLPAVLLVTKLDLIAEDHPALQLIRAYQSLLPMADASDLTAVLALLDNKITVLTGQSGVGKSTALNRLNPDFQLVTQTISKALGRGKHTTRFTCLYPIGNGWVADTPGFSSLDFTKYSTHDFYQHLTLFQPYLGQCRYRDCIHEHEPGCKIKQLVQDKILDQQYYQDYIDCLSLIRDQ
jgi:ribosome biogenesis GTPase / thiamine phosphate phosphatase